MKWKKSTDEYPKKTNYYFVKHDCGMDIFDFDKQKNEWIFIQDCCRDNTPVKYSGYIDFLWLDEESK